MTDRNENRPGYKKTKVGWIPDEWEVLPASEVFDIQLGKMLSEKARQGKNPQPYLANYNVQWGGFDRSAIQKMDFSEREMEKFQLKKEDLLVCKGGEVGRCAIWEEQINHCFYQKALHRVRPQIDDIDMFYSFWLSSCSSSFCGKNEKREVTTEVTMEVKLLLNLTTGDYFCKELQEMFGFRIERN